uniref:Uncharacterized protein n=1 Tax=Romanomermis culicivorax TaxID=13658 RepID=A0A915I5U5_ROMCU
MVTCEYVVRLAYQLTIRSRVRAGFYMPDSGSVPALGEAGHGFYQKLSDCLKSINRKTYTVNSACYLGPTISRTKST